VTKARPAEARSHPKFLFHRAVRGETETRVEEAAVGPAQPAFSGQRWKVVPVADFERAPLRVRAARRGGTF